jgi:hypothetical protein
MSEMSESDESERYMESESGERLFGGFKEVRVLCITLALSVCGTACC